MNRIDEISRDLRRHAAAMPGGEYPYAVGMIRYAVNDGLATRAERLTAIAEVLTALDRAGESHG